MRRIYESETDRQNQRKVSEYLEEVWDCKFKKAISLEAIDGAVFTLDKKLAALIEIKKTIQRKHPIPNLHAVSTKMASRYGIV